MAQAFFQRRATKDLDADIVVTKEALAHLEAWRKQALSAIATFSSPMVPPEGSLFAGLLLAILGQFGLVIEHYIYIYIYIYIVVYMNF